MAKGQKRAASKNRTGIRLTMGTIAQRNGAHCYYKIKKHPDKRKKFTKVTLSRPPGKCTIRQKGLRPRITGREGVLHFNFELRVFTEVVV